MNINETIEFSKSCIENLFIISIDINSYSYLLSDFTINENYLYRIECDKFSWKQLTEIKERKNDWWTYYVTLKLDFEGDIIVQDRDKTISKKAAKFDLFIDLWFKTDRIQFSYRILDQNYKTIKDYVQQIEDSNLLHGIYSILSEQVKFNNKSFLTFATDILRKPRSINVSINDFEIIDDIARISQDIGFLFGEIIQLKKYLGSYISNPQSFNGKVYYNYSPSFIDKRYFFLVGVMLEILYNYWDKIGDLLAIYFTPNIHSRQIYFPKVIDNITSPYDQSSNYIWLKTFKDNDYSLLNTERKQVVHYKNIESKFHDLYRSNFDNKVELEKLQQEKIDMTTFLDKQHKLTFDGFEKSFLLIDEIN